MTKNRPGLAFCLSALSLFLLALLLRLWLAPMRGHVHDVAQLKTWAQIAATQDPRTIYSSSTANYPPLALLPLAAAGSLYRAWFSPDFQDSDHWTALIKLPAIAADLVTAGLIFFLVRRRHGRRPALLCAAGYALNPAVWYMSAWWGQLESLYALPMLLSMAALVSGRPAGAWVFLALALLVKPQAAVIAPVLLVVSWRLGGWHSVVRGLLGAALVLALVVAPLAWVGQLPALWAQLRASAGRQLFLTMNAHNLWYLLTLGWGSFAARGGHAIYDTRALLGPLTGWQIGLVLLGVWVLLVSLLLWRRLSHLAPGRALRSWEARLVYLASAALVLGFFMLPAESHERYLFPALAPLVLLYTRWPGARWLYLGLSLTLWLNLLWVDPAVPLPGFSGQLPWGMPIAALNLLLSGLAIWGIWNPGRASPTFRRG